MRGVVHGLGFAEQGGVKDLQVDGGARREEESSLGHSGDVSQGAVFQGDGSTVLDVETSS